MVSPRDPLFEDVFRAKRVLLTGHTGFKGGWLSLWLARLGARVTGVSLPPDPAPTFFEACRVADHVENRFVDITDYPAMLCTLDGVDADIVVHMAAQSLVRRSYEDPAGTFGTNVLGTANVLEFARRLPSAKAVVVITSDKCYENQEWAWGYRENDPLGGADPYSASKGCAEILSHSYRRSFFADPSGAQLATARAGNVFGGGDWGRDRLVPDLVRAAASGHDMPIRNPSSVRPWQHVLEPLSGYLLLVQKLLTQGEPFAGAWNFGPGVESTVPVREFAERFGAAWGKGAPRVMISPQERAGTLHEAGLLRLDSTKARVHLGWSPRLDLHAAIGLTADWYRRFLAGETMAGITETQIQTYEGLMHGTDTAEPALVAAQ